jgi:osmotically-inducible protein OsmY
MADEPTDLDPYLAEHVREALAQDARVGELGVEVEISDETVILSGTLTTPERQEAATAVVHDLLPDHHVRNEIAVTDHPESTEVEHLP